MADAIIARNTTVRIPGAGLKAYWDRAVEIAREGQEVVTITWSGMTFQVSEATPWGEVELLADVFRNAVPMGEWPWPTGKPIPQEAIRLLEKKKEDATRAWDARVASWRQAEEDLRRCAESRSTEGLREAVDAKLEAGMFASVDLPGLSAQAWSWLQGALQGIGIGSEKGQNPPHEGGAPYIRFWRAGGLATRRCSCS